jgi:hypothetical protein
MDLDGAFNLAKFGYNFSEIVEISFQWKSQLERQNN